MPGFNQWLDSKNRQLRQRQVYGTPMGDADPAGEEIGQEAMANMRQGRRRSGGGSNYSGRPAKVATGYGARVTRRFR